MKLGPGREFDAIRAMLERWGPRASGIGDDAAVLEIPDDERLVASVDTSVENRHFRREWLAPDEIGWRATVGGLSDLAAMGARARGVLVALGVPEAWRDALESLAEGIGEAAAAAGAPIVGGDIVDAGELSLSITALGSARRPVPRGGAQPGDRLFVTGRFGGPGAAIAALRRGEKPRDLWRERLARPVARIAAGRWLGLRGATAMIDISDGLAADAGHIAAASDVRLEIDLDRLPRVEGVEPAAAAASGEEYELLVALPADASVSGAEAAIEVPLTEIGMVRSGGSKVVTLLDGKPVRVPAGYDHFAG